MATSSTTYPPSVSAEQEPNAAQQTRGGSILGLLPGIALLAVVGYAGKWIEQSIAHYGKAHHQVLPNIEYVLWAILIGLAIANTVGVPKIFQAGVATYEFWLKAGIILLGARFILGDILHLSGISFVLIFVELALALTFMTYLGRGFKLPPKLITLLAVGSSVCGVSAIIATQGAIEADEEDSSVAIAAILALGAISLFAFPAVGHVLHMSDHAYGLWTGLAVDNTAEATAAGALYSDTAGKFAVLAKTCRNACIGFVVLGYALYWARKGQAKEIAHKGAFLWKKFPKFVLGFLFISLLVTLGTLDVKTFPHLAWLVPFGFTRPQIAALGNLSRWAFLLTFAGVGLRTSLRDLLKQGLKPFLVGAIGEIAIACITLALVLGADRLYHL